MLKKFHVPWVNIVAWIQHYSSIPLPNSLSFIATAMLNIFYDKIIPKMRACIQRGNRTRCYLGSIPRIELRTFCTRSRNHFARQNGQRSLRCAQSNFKIFKKRNLVIFLSIDVMEYLPSLQSFLLKHNRHPRTHGKHHHYNHQYK